MDPRQQRSRRAAKWIGLPLCAALISLWILSVFSVTWVAVRRQAGLNIRVGLALGCVSFHSRTGLRYDRPPPLVTARMMGRDVSFPWFRWWPRRDQAGTSFGGVWIPLWIPFLFTAALTTRLWWRAPARAPNHCPCGYNLAGLAPDTPCPECGRKAVA